MSLYLGIDGGGSKTELVIVDSAGTVLARAHRSSSDYYRIGVQRVTENLSDGVAEVCQQAGIPADRLDFTVVGVPGYGEAQADVPILDAAPLAALGHERFLCVNDMVCGWAGSLAATDGINVIGGTGSMTYGERNGSRARVGGWGELFGDEGSGYWIATLGLNAFTKMSDGRLARGPLYQLVKERLNLEHDLGLMGIVFNEWHKGRTQIAALSRTVAEAASAGDSVASTILQEAGAELARLVHATRRTLEFEPGEVVPVSYSGGVFSSDTVLAGFSEALSALNAGYDLRIPQYEPVLGAALYAAKVSGRPLNEDALARLSHGWNPVNASDTRLVSSPGADHE